MLQVHDFAPHSEEPVNNDIWPDDQAAVDPVQQVKAWLIGNWRKDAGAFVDRMLQDQPDAFRQLKHPDWKVRYTALSILQLHWNTAIGELAEKCEDMGLHDLHPQVRSCALLMLGMCYDNTNDFRIGKLLAQVVLDETQPSEARRGAYLALYYLRGRRFEWRGGQDDLPTILCIPDDVDWPFVRGFVIGEK